MKSFLMQDSIYNLFQISNVLIFMVKLIILHKQNKVKGIKKSIKNFSPIPIWMGLGGHVSVCLFVCPCVFHSEKVE
jgi:hypothetical protein